MALGNKAEYYARYAWVNAKKRLGLSVKSDKKFFCEVIVRGMMSGDINKNVVFVNEEMPDEGIGSQILSRLSVASTAKYLGYGFAYTPLYKLGHPEGEKSTWTKRIDETFGLGRDELPADACKLRRVNFTQFCNDKDLWREDLMVSVRDFYAYTDHNPDVLVNYAKEKIRLDGKERSEHLDIAMHVRRGDVSKKQNKNRYIPNARIKRTIETTTKLMSALDIPFRISIYTNGSTEEMSDLLGDNVSIVNTLGAMDTLRGLANSDMLVATNSTFSYLSAILNKGVVIFDRYTHPQLSEWIHLRKDGSFDEDRAKQLIEQKHLER